MHDCDNTNLCHNNSGCSPGDPWVAGGISRRRYDSWISGWARRRAVCGCSRARGWRKPQAGGSGASGTSPRGSINSPGPSSASQPRSTSRFSFERSPSILDLSVLSPAAAAMSPARSGRPASARTSSREPGCIRKKLTSSFPPGDPPRRGRARRATHARPRLPASIFRINEERGITGHSGDPHSRPGRDHRAEGARGPVLAAKADQPGVITDLLSHGRRAGHPAPPDDRLVIRTEQRVADCQACRHDHRERPGLQP
jgi:hypothetical protein